MTIWFAIAGMAAIVIAALLGPLFRHAGTTVPRRQRELAIYKDQLAELQRELEANRISEAESKAAEVEIQRKMLASASTTDSAETPTESASATPVRLVATVAIASLAPIGALLVYLSVGSPGEPGHAFDQGAQQIDVAAKALIARLAERLRQDPNNLEGWALLARSYGALQHHAEAAQAYERVYELTSASVTHAGDYGEALVLAAGGQVAPKARQLFEQVMEADPGDPRARFYIALALSQSGKARDAIAMWRGLETDSPPDAPWLPALREAVRVAAAESNIDAETVPPAAQAPIAPQPGPTADEVDAAQSLSPDEQQQMIQAMVAQLAERLQSNPDDLEGWRRLGRSYLVLDEPVRARDAYARAVAMAPTDLALLADYANASLLAPGPVAAPKESVEALRRVLTADAADPTALWLVGLAESASGNQAEAAPLWRRLLQQLTPGSIPYQTVKARLDALTTAP